MIDLHLPLTEVERWDLEDVRKVNALLDSRQAYDTALDAYQAEQ